VSGRGASEKIRDSEKLVHLSCRAEVLESVDTTLQKFWSVEDLPPKAKVHTPEQQLCRSNLTQTLLVYHTGNILSVTARLFDPLDLLCPLVIRAKMLLQEVLFHLINCRSAVSHSKI